MSFIFPMSFNFAGVKSIHEYKTCVSVTEEGACMWALGVSTHACVHVHIRAYLFSYLFCLLNLS